MQGIMLLCSTVAEVTNRIGMHNSKNTQMLKSFVGTSGATATLPAAGPQASVEVLEGLSSPSAGGGGSSGLLGLIEGGAADGVARVVSSSGSSIGGPPTNLGSFASGLRRFMPS